MDLKLHISANIRIFMQIKDFICGILKHNPVLCATLNLDFKMPQIPNQNGTAGKLNGLIRSYKKQIDILKNVNTYEATAISRYGWCSGRCV